MDAAPPPPGRRPRLQLPDADAATLDILPPEVLDAILSRLSLRDAVRTSALSRAWRRRWESVPSLEFKWSNPLDVAPSSVDPGAITAVLNRYSCPVRKFDHWGITDAAVRHFNGWLRFLARKGVRSLSLLFERGSDESSIHTLHPSIFSCRDLKVLFLHQCDVPATLPGSAGLPNLTTLHLSGVGFIGDAARELELLIAASPLLDGQILEVLRITESNDP